jgi:hypothetical protein
LGLAAEIRENRRTLLFLKQKRRGNFSAHGSVVRVHKGQAWKGQEQSVSPREAGRRL